MKVIQISTFYKPAVGGVEKQVEGIADHLHKNAIQVEVWTTDANHGASKRLGIPNDEFRMTNKIQGENSALDTRHSAFEVRRFAYWFGLGHFFRFTPVLLIKLLFSQFDIIHVHNAHDAHLLGAILIRIVRRKKLVLTGHNPFIVSSEKRGEELNSKVGFFDRVLKLLAKYIDTYIALLDSEKEFVSQYLGIPEEKIAVIPNGISDLYYDENKNQDLTTKEANQKYDLIVGDICRMDVVKGIQNLKFASDNLPNVQFLFIGGDGGYLEELKELYKDNKNVYFNETYISPNDAKEFYNYIDLFVSPSLYEPFGITLVEAMTQGKVVLASNSAGPKEIIKDEFGELIDSVDQEKWFERIKYYVEHKEELETKGKAAIEASQKYRWEKVIGQIIDVYKELSQVSSTQSYIDA